MAHTTDHLRRLRRYAETASLYGIRTSNRRLTLIREALAAGHSRTEIAAALGISRQALGKYLRRRGENES